MRHASLDTRNKCIYIYPVRITFDPRKRSVTLAMRGLDFVDAAAVFAGPTATVVDDRKEYGEVRYISAGFLKGRMVVVVWTPRKEARHIISMRYCHADEEILWRKNMDRPG